MIKTFEIDLDDALVKNAAEIFEALGTDIDTAIKMFLTQTTLRKGFPFDVAIPDNEEKEQPAEICVEDDLHTGVSEEEEIASRVAANEALVAQMREEIGDKAVIPEFDETEDDGTHGDYDSKTVQTVSEPVNSSSSEEDDDEDEDETTPDNLFDSWDVGEDEDIGCR
ncbi:type II toxin-antitoxin system RelB/DinJ family antitoxin [Treponema sp.]|uniref:type II toxin-antitoxin system RelB/DinJ family antitoxin n=1 Tax=Treponema sp. TaxID=166 RepID=UPI00388E4775